MNASIKIPAGGVRLNVGCGRHVLDGWVNCDLAVSPLAARAPELLCSAASIPLPDESVKELMAIHLFEHLYLWECDGVLAEWHRLMKPDALLVLEMPDLFKFCENVLVAKKGKVHPDQMGMWGLYGDPRDKDPLMMHKWGWTFRTLAPFLEEHGFYKCNEQQTKWHRVGRDDRDFRIEARRK